MIHHHHAQAPTLPFPSHSLGPNLIPNPTRTHVSLLHQIRTPSELQQLHASAIKLSLPISPLLLSLYSNPRFGSLHQARTLFSHLHIPDNPNPLPYNALLKRHVDEHHSHDALLLLNALLIGSQFAPDNFTFPPIIKGCAHLQAFAEGKQLHAFALKTGFASDNFVESSLVSFYSKCADLSSAKKVFDRAGSRDLVTFNCLIDGYVRSGEIEIARKLFDGMTERDSFSWITLIGGYGNAGKPEVARELFDRMPEKNVVSWNAMIGGYMKSGDFASARCLFGSMPVKNVVSWNSVIAGFEKLGRFEEALEVYGRMFSEGTVPNIVTMVSMLSAISGLALLEKGRSIHKYMKDNSFGFDGVLGTGLIEMYSKCGSIESAIAVFRGIKRKKLGHWTAMIMGLGMHGMPVKCCELFEKMRENGMKPHAIAFVGLLNACSHAGLVEEGRRYFELMRNEYGIKPTIEHYGCLVDLLCRVGKLEDARNIIIRMPMRPNKIIWMSLLSGCRKYRNVEIGEFAAKNVIELDPEATGCYVLLSNIYAAVGLWDNVSKLRSMMKERGVRKEPGQSLVEHKGVVHKFVVGDRSNPQTEEIYSKLDEMGRRLKYKGHTPDTSQVLLCVEERDKEAELAHHSERLAIAFSLINVDKGNSIRIVKNLRVCNDCHNVTKLLSSIYECDIIVRDNSRFHHFKNGYCSCMDYW